MVLFGQLPVGSSDFALRCSLPQAQGLVEASRIHGLVGPWETTIHSWETIEK